MTMKSVDPAHLRSVVLAGHAGAGKTTLAEHLLFQAGAIHAPRRWTTERPTSTTSPRSRSAQLSLSPGGRDVRARRTRITLVDTPGYADFVGEVVAGFAAADAALIIDGRLGGRRGGSETAIGLGRSTGRGGVFVITKCDRENADPPRRSTRFGREFGTKIAPLHVAIGAGGVVPGLRRRRPPKA